MTDPTFPQHALPQPDAESPVRYDGDDLLDLVLVPDFVCDADSDRVFGKFGITWRNDYVVVFPSGQVVRAT